MTRTPGMLRPRGSNNYQRLEWMQTSVNRSRRSQTHSHGRGRRFKPRCAHSVLSLEILGPSAARPAPFESPFSAECSKNAANFSLAPLGVAFSDSSWRAAVVPRPEASLALEVPESRSPAGWRPERQGEGATRLPWAELFKRVWRTDVLRCVRC